MKKLLVLTLVCAMLLGVVGCTTTTTPAEGSADTKEALKVALCMTGPVNDGGWCQTAYSGLEEAKAQYDIEISYTENLQATEMEAAFTDYAAQGYDMVFGLGYQFGDPALTVGAKYPDTKFIIFEGSVEAENVQSCKIANEQSRYLLGFLAAKLSKTGVVGFVAGVEQPSIVKPAEAFKLGARAANPDVKVLITYTGSFTDVALGKEAALAMIDQGADVIGHGANTCGNGAIKACEERGVMAMGAASDQYELAPDAVVCCDVYSFGDVLVYAVGEMTEGRFEGGTFSYGFAEGLITLAPFHNFEDKIPQDVKDALEAEKQAIIDGTIVVPIIETPTAD